MKRSAGEANRLWHEAREEKVKEGTKYKPKAQSEC